MPELQQCMKCGKWKQPEKFSKYSKGVCRPCLCAYQNLHRDKPKTYQQALQWYKYLGSTNREAKMLQALCCNKETATRGAEIIKLMRFCRTLEERGKLSKDESEYWRDIVTRFDRRNRTDSRSAPVLTQRYMVNT